MGFAYAMGKRALGTYFILSYWGLLLKGLNGSNGSNLIPTLYLRYLPYSLYLIPDTYLTSLMGFAYGQKGTWHLRLCFFFFQTGALTSCSSCYWGLLLTLKCIGVIYIYVH